MEHDAGSRKSLLRAWPLALLAGSMLPAMAQDAAKVQPGSYKVTLENDQVRVLEYNSRPGMAVCGQGVHSHPAHLTILLTPDRVRFREPGGQWVDGGVHKEGTTFWSEAGTHEVENISGHDIRVLVVELKQPGLVKRPVAAPR